VALKQGAGRLIRRESDHGVLVVCDTRLTRMGYGRRLRAALPPMKLLKTEAEFEQMLDELRGPNAEPLAEPVLTRPSTTGRPCCGSRA
jgi:ATP-dependent DNA helicase DinG